MTKYSKYFKRFFDLIFSVTLIIILSPLMVFICLLIKLKLGSPIIFKQQRPGLNNELFTIYKFRSMTNTRNVSGEFLSDKARLTKFGKFLRSTSIDELPELFNIISGKMSFVGPRPQLIKDLVFMDDTVLERHTVRPGLTGLAQISGRNQLSWNDKFLLDLEYIKNVTFFNDMKIILKTFKKVLIKDGISSENHVTSLDYGEYLFRNNLITKNDFDLGILKAKEIEISKSKSAI